MTDASRVDRFPRAWLFGALGVVLARALLNLQFPIGRDQATYCVIGQGILDGRLPYRDLWDNKPPGIFFIYSAIVKLFGHVMWSVAVVDILLLLATSYLIFRFAHRHLGAPAAALGVAIGASWHCSAGYVRAAQPEGFVLLLVLAAFLLLNSEKHRWALRSLSAGVLLGAAVWVKYNALVFFPFVALIPYLDFTALDAPRRRIELKISLRDLGVRTGMFCAGIVAISGAVLAYFWLSGDWTAFWESQFEVLLRYGTMGYEQESLWLRAFVLVYERLGPWKIAIPAATLLVAWRNRELARVAPIVFAAFFGLAAAIAQGRFHSYYFEIVNPFAALMWGYVCVQGFVGFQVARRALARRGWALASGLSWLVLANVVYALLLPHALNVARDFESLRKWVGDTRGSYLDYFPQHPLEKLPDQMRVIEYLRVNSEPEDQVYVWGTAPLINFLAKRNSPSRFVSNLALISAWGPPRWRAELMRELRESPPRFIVVARHDAIPPVSNTWKDSEQSLKDFAQLATFIESRYRLAVAFRDFVVYRLK